MHTLSLIVAYEKHRGIGRDGQLPWRLPSDLAWFKQVTMGCPIIMGRKTWTSIGRPLPGRLNIVISRHSSGGLAGAEVVGSLNEAIALARQHHPDPAGEIFVIGGAQIFELALPIADRLYATEIAQAVPSDVFFPPLPAQHWVEVSRQPQPAENGLDFAFVIYEQQRQA